MAAEKDGMDGKKSPFGKEMAKDGKKSMPKRMPARKSSRK